MQEPFRFLVRVLVVLKGKMIQGSRIQEDFGLSLLKTPFSLAFHSDSQAGRPGVGLSTQIHR